MAASWHNSVTSLAVNSWLFCKRDKNWPSVLLSIFFEKMWHNLFAGDAAVLTIIFQFIRETESFGLTCKQFYSIHAQQCAKFKYLIFYNARNLQYILNSATLKQYLLHVDIFHVWPGIKLVLERFANQLERIFFNVPANSMLTQLLLENISAFTKLKHLELGIALDENSMELVKSWLCRAPQLQILGLSLQFPHEIEDSKKSSVMHELAIVVNKVPVVNLFMDTTSIELANPFADHLHMLHATTNNPNWNHVISDCTKLEELFVNFYARLHNDIPIILNCSNLKIFKLHSYEPENEASEHMLFKYLPASLESLEVINSKLHVFPSIAHLTKLKKLEIVYTDISNADESPSWLQSMKCLKALTISPKFDVLDKQFVVQHLPSSLQTFTTNCTVNSLPSSITSLCFSATRFSNLQGMFQQIAKVNNLSLNFCDMSVNTNFPFHLLKYIEVLTISDQKIVTLQELYHLRNLTKLSANYCRLTCIPLECAQLPCLKHLDLQSNNISNIDEQLLDERGGYFPVLEQLSLAANPVPNYPSKIYLSKLKMLAISPYTEDATASELVEPAFVNRKQWTNIALEHMNQKQDSPSQTEGSQTVLDAYLSFAIPCTSNKILLCCHLLMSQLVTNESLELKPEKFTQVVNILVHVPTMQVIQETPCWHVSCILKFPDSQTEQDE